MSPELAYYFFAFLVGSIPFGLLVARAFSVKNLRQKGSGNIGATNVARVAGFWPAGFLTFFFDFLKGALPVFLLNLEAAREAIGDLLGSPLEAHLGVIWTAGLLAVLGHCFSPWLGFRGGKGVATGLGVILVLSPASALVAGLVYFLVFAMSGTGSLASLFSIGMAAVAYVVLNPYGSHVWAGALLVATIFWRHESNIDALLERRERAF